MREIKKKLVTADDYRHDRDYWKRRALKQQRVIDTIRTHNNRLGNAERAASHALENFRNKLQAICPHNGEHIEAETEVFTGEKLYYCGFCKSFVEESKVTNFGKIAIKK